MVCRGPCVGADAPFDDGGGRVELVVCSAYIDEKEKHDARLI